MTGSKDLTCRVWTLMPTEGFVPMVLAGHKDQVTACFFSTHDTSIAYPSLRLRHIRVAVAGRQRGPGGGGRGG